MKLTHHQALENAHRERGEILSQSEQVSQYLLSHPDFLKQNPTLLSQLDLGHGVEGATSLVERQIKVLRERNQLLQGQVIEMMHAAYANEALLINCNQFMLDMLAAEDFNSLCRLISSALIRDFSLDAIKLVLVGDALLQDPSLLWLSQAEALNSLVKVQMNQSQTLCGSLEMPIKQALFGEQADSLQSFALIPLGDACKTGLLVLASRDETRFDPEMGTLFVDLIGKLVSHLVKVHVAAN